MKRIILFITITILIVSCSKNVINSSFHKVIDLNSNNLESELMDYSNIFIKNEADATLILEYYDESINSNEVKIGAYFRTFPISNPESGNLQIGNLNLPLKITERGLSFVPDNVDELQFSGSNSWIQKFDNINSILGNKVNISFNVNNDELISLNEHIPPILNMEISGEISENFPTHKIIGRENVLLKWNKFESNSDGVLIMVRYNGVDSENVLDSTSGNDVYNLIILEDDGEQILSQSLFEGVPKDGMVDIEVWRGNVDKYETTNKKSINVHLISKSGFSLILKD